MRAVVSNDGRPFDQIKNSLNQHRGKTSAHALVLENIVGNLNPVS